MKREFALFRVPAHANLAVCHSAEGYTLYLGNYLTRKRCVSFRRDYVEKSSPSN